MKKEQKKVYKLTMYCEGKATEPQELKLELTSSDTDVVREEVTKFMNCVIISEADFIQIDIFKSLV